MNKEYLNVITADDDEGTIIFFKSIFKTLKIGVKSQCFSNGRELIEYLHSNETIIPELLLINYNFPGNSTIAFLNGIKADPRLSNMVIAVYADQISENEIEEVLVSGANIFMKKPEKYEDLKKSLTEIITINWQYHTTGFNKDNFIMKV